MNTIAIYTGSTAVYWSGIIIALGALAGFLLGYAIYKGHYVHESGLLIIFPAAIILSVLFSRMIHWYCHVEQYKSLFDAVTNYEYGGYSIPGVFFGTWLAVFIAEKIGIIDSRGKVLDALSPGLCLSFAFIRLSALFNSSCRGKMSITDPKHRHLPYGVPAYNSAGEVSGYKFATFFVEFLVLLILTLVLIFMYYKLHNCRMKNGSERDGNIARLFTVFACAIELVCDSTRNDSCFMNFKKSFLQLLNKFASFISIVQLIAAITALCIMIYYLKRSKRAGNPKAKTTVLMILFFVSIIIVGVSEYLVQRYTNEYRLFYATQSFGAILMAADIFLLYDSCRQKS